MAVWLESKPASFPPWFSLDGYAQQPADRFRRSRQIPDMLKKFALFLLVSMAALHAAEPATAALTPADAVAASLAGNRDLAAARFAIREAEARLQQAGLWPNPELELSHGNDILFSNEGEYSLSTGFKQRFPVTQRLVKAKDVARVDVAMALAEIRDRERLIAGDVLRRSRALLVAREQLVANRESQGLAQKLVELSANRLKAAEASAADVNSAKLELQKLQLEEASLLNQEESMKAELTGLLGRAPGTPLEMTGPLDLNFVPAAVAEASRGATARRPDRQLAALGVDRAAAEIVLARAEKWEDWTVGFDYFRAYGRFAPPVGGKLDNSIGLSVSIPLPLRNKNQGNISEAQARRQRTEAEVQALDLRIVTEVQATETQLRRLADLARQYLDQPMKLAEENIALLQKGYADGLIGIAPVIQAQQQAGALRRGYLDTVAEFERVRTDWETAAAITVSSKPE